MRHSQAKVGAASGTSERTVRLIEKAERDSYQSSTLRAISQALAWTPESIELILEGGEPIEASALKPISDPVVARRLEALERQGRGDSADVLEKLAELERRLSELEAIVAAQAEDRADFEARAERGRATRKAKAAARPGG